MKERSKERMAQLLLEELFAELGERENVKRMLGDLTPLPVDEVVRTLAADVESAIARRRIEALETAQKKTAAIQPAPPLPVTPAPVESRDVLSTPPPAPTVAPPASPPPPPSANKVEQPPPASKESTYWGELERILRGEEPPAAPTPPMVETTLRDPEPEDESAILEAAEDERDAEETNDDEAVVIAPGNREQRTPAKFTDDDLVYLHGYSLLAPDQVPAPGPFMLEEKGIDTRTFAFAHDYAGMRFYLSTIMPSVMNVSKTGVLLLGKQESLQTRGTHEAVLNELRMHGMILPFAFGTVARGKDDFEGKVDAHLDELREAFGTVAATKWWTVTLNVLDAKIAQLVGTEESSSARKGRITERTSYTKMPSTKKFDIKLLERILNREKRIAESVHEELKSAANRADVDMIVSLGSGSSEDWKPILKGSYEVKPEGFKNFCRAVTDLQYRHIMFDLMLAVSGDHDAFSFDGG